MWALKVYHIECARAAVLWDGCERLYLDVKCLYNQLELVREVVSHEGE